MKGGTPPVNNPSAGLSCYGSPRPQHWQILRSSHYCVSYRKDNCLPAKDKDSLPNTDLKKKLSLTKQMLTWIQLSTHTDLYTCLYTCCMFLSFQCTIVKCLSFISLNKCEYKIVIMLLSCPETMWRISGSFKFVTFSLGVVSVITQSSTWDLQLF